MPPLFPSIDPNTVSPHVQTLYEKHNAGIPPYNSELIKLLQLKDPEEIFPLTTYLREITFGHQIQLCSIINAKSGSCSEDCSYCSQSRYHSCDVNSYSLLDQQKLDLAYQQAQKFPVQYVSMVTSGRSASPHDCLQLAKSSRRNYSTASHCASLGLLNAKEMRALRNGGISRFHHNLEAAPNFFPKLCTTHTFADRVNTIKAAQDEGLSICSGGIFGIGESDEDIVELALQLKALHVDAVPINFLVKIPGTRCNPSSLSPQKCLLIIALFRLILPQAEIIVAGGRLESLKTKHELIFKAGANGCITGNYLTTRGRTIQDDLDMIQRLGLELRPQ